MRFLDIVTIDLCKKRFDFRISSMTIVDDDDESKIDESDDEERNDDESNDDKRDDDDDERDDDVDNKRFFFDRRFSFLNRFLMIFLFFVFVSKTTFVFVLIS